MKILITGVSSGVGKALAEECLRRGDEVWGVARRQVNLPGFMFTLCDVSDPEQVDLAFQEMSKKNFMPDVVVLNAGIYEGDSEGRYNQEVATKVFSINVYGALIWIEKFLPKFLERKQGQFIAISSIAAYRPDPASSAYPASKAALTMAFRSLRLRYSGTGVKFKAIHFGPIDTLVIPRFVNSKKGKWVVSAEDAARYIIKVIARKGGMFYFPLNSWIIKFTSFLPDSLFHSLTKKLRR